MKIATKTLCAIEEIIGADNGASYRQHLGGVIMDMRDAYESGDSLRSHMGASLIGGECGRAIWYGFRWAVKNSFSGRMIRLFNRGHLEEARFIAMLRAIGCNVWYQDDEGRQFRISDCNGHFGGSCDAVAVGIPDIGNTPALCEFKTSGEKAFLKLQKEGVFAAKPEHYAQMNIYMNKLDLPVALYLVVNKNNDELYGEIVDRDDNIAKYYINRAANLIYSDKPPMRLNEDVGYWKCRFCNAKSVCHNGAPLEVNCRTCRYSVIAEKSQWVCSEKDLIISKENQLIACEKYRVIQ